MTTILAPIDLSDISAEVVAHASRLARALDGRVVLVTVLLEPVFLKEYAPPTEEDRRVTIGNERAVQRRLAVLARQLARGSVLSESVIVRGAPARIILEQARKTKANYIVMGSHGHSAFFHLIAGSTTQGVLKCARCPVVIIPAHAQRGKPRRT
jgi:nucleotide-binding universal stress UspA family protein